MIFTSNDCCYEQLSLFRPLTVLKKGIYDTQKFYITYLLFNPTAANLTFKVDNINNSFFQKHMSIFYV